jgi:hypothetical protein
VFLRGLLNRYGGALITTLMPRCGLSVGR